MAAYRAGAVLVPVPGIIPSGAGLTFDTWTAQSRQDYYTTGSGDPVAQQPARVVWFDAGHGVNGTAFISPQTAAQLGMKQVPSRVIGTFTAPASDALVDSMTAAAETAPEDASLSVYREDGPAPVTPWLALIVAATGVLVIAASAVCLGLARFERRPDDATLSSVGAQRSIRRRINAWQAAILVGIGAVVGTVAGVIPLWGFSTSDPTGFPVDGIPWLWLLLVAIGLPLVVTAAAWAVPPRHPDLTRRTAIA